MTNELALKRLLTQDVFVSHMCLFCCMHAALFVVRGEYVGLCPKCVGARIARLSESQSPLPDWVHTLWAQAKTEERVQIEQEARQFELRWDDLYKCESCGKIIHEDDARYFFEPGRSESAPRCQKCFDQLNARPN